MLLELCKRSRYTKSRILVTTKRSNHSRLLFIKQAQWLTLDEITRILGLHPDEKGHEITSCVQGYEASVMCFSIAEPWN